MYAKMHLNGEKQQLVPFATNQGHVLSDDLYTVIRAIVPPPPACPMTTVTIPTPNGHCVLLGQLFTRRPTEQCLLDKVKGQSSSPGEASNHLEDIFIQLIEPLKYSDGDRVMHSVSYLMRGWPMDEAVQTQALKCLECLSQQCDDLCPSQIEVHPILKAMERYQKNEMIQRMGVKVLKHKGFLNQVGKKIDMACIIFNSLCSIPKVDDFMLHAKDIVRELKQDEKVIIRSCKQYVDMLLDFPNRKDNQITVSCCLYELAAVAHCDFLDLDGRWDVLINTDGKRRLQKLCERPELEDRCKALLRKVFDAENVQNGQLNSASLVTTANILNRCFISKAATEFLSEKQSSLSLAKEDFEHEGQFSDDDIVPTRSPVTPYGSPSQSFSPPLTTHPVLASNCSELQRSNLPVESESTQTNQKSNANQGIVPKPVENVALQSKGKCKAKSVSTKNSTSVQCIICNEPQGKQSLLLMQYKQISHCLQQPSNKLLFNCIESNLCEDHKI